MNAWFISRHLSKLEQPELIDTNAETILIESREESREERREREVQLLSLGLQREIHARQERISPFLF